MAIIRVAPLNLIARRPAGLLAVAAGAVALLLAGVGLAQEAASRSPVGKTISEIRITGNQKVSEHEIRGQIKTRVGQPYNRQAIQEDIARIYALGSVELVEPQTEVTDAGVVLTLRVVERSRIESVEYNGARSISAKDLGAETGLAAGEFLDRAKLALARQTILELYHGKGYFFADVQLDADALAKDRVVFNIREGQRVRVKKIAFRGNDTLSEAALKKQIETKKYFWIFSAGTLDEQTVRQDVIRLVQYYRDEGYLDAEVSYQLEFSDDKRTVTVVFLIHEGPRYRVASVQFEGNTLFPAMALREQMLLQPDNYYTEQARQHDVKAIRENVYGREGYINTAVDIRHGFADEKGRLNVTVSVREGEKITVGRINIIGNDITKDKVIRRGLSFYPEQPYNVLEVQASRERLSNSGLFEKVEITPEADGGGNQRDVLVSVTEQDTGRFLIGVGISSDAGLLGNVSLEQRNFDLFAWPKTAKQLFTGRAFKGAGQTLRIVAEPGTELNRFQVQFYEPFLLDRPLAFGSNLFLFTRPRESYDESRVGTVLSLGRRLRGDWSVEGAFRIEGISISDVDDDSAKDIQDAEGSHALIGGKFTLARDTTDNRFLPTRGNRYSVSVEPVGGTETFVRLAGDYRAYRTVRTDVYDRKSVASGRFNMGYIAGDAPVYERFYAGGISTMRGFRFRGVGPHDGPDDDPIGGNFIVLASGEYAFPLWGKSSGAFFLDTGTVEETATITTWRASVGFEVRIPIEFFGSVPLTFGIGVPILKESTDDTQPFYFLFGTSF